MFPGKNDKSPGGLITLIIPTFNRPVFLQRVLSYYSDLRAPFNIVVADSSSGAALEQNRKIVGSAQAGLKLDQQIYSADTTPFAKLSTTLKTICSTFVAICADDDFIIPDAIANCVAFLEHNPEYAIAHGCSVAVRVSAEGEIREASNYPQRSIELDEAGDRLEDHLRNYTATYYSVHRRSQLTANMQQAHYHTADYRLGELLPSCLSVIQGKAKSLEVLYMVRQADFEPPKYGEKTRSWEDLIGLDDFPERYARFRKCLVDELMEASTTSCDDANAIVDRAFLSYVAASVPRRNQQPHRIRQLVRRLPLARRAATIGRELLTMMTNPQPSDQEAGMNDPMSLPTLLDPSFSFHSQFMNVYRHIDSAWALPDAGIVDRHGR